MLNYIHWAIFATSAGANAIFWYALGIKMSDTAENVAIAGVILAVLFLMADLLKVKLPTYPRYDLTRKIAVATISAVSIITTTVTASHALQRIYSADQIADLTQLEVAAKTEAAQARVDNAVPSDNAQKTIAQLNAKAAQIGTQINELLAQPARNLAGHIAFKGNTKMSVASATKNCTSNDVWMQVTANAAACNQARALQAERTNLKAEADKLSNDVNISIDNKEALALTFSEAKAELKENQKSLPLLPILSKLIDVFGGDKAKQLAADTMALIYMIGFAIAVVIELILHASIEKPEPAEPVKTETLLSKIAGKLRGYLSDKPRIHQPVLLDRSESSYIERFTSGRFDDVIQFFDFPAAAQQTGIEITDLHVECIVLMCQRYGQPLAYLALEKEWRGKYGINRHHIGPCNQIMAAHGYRLPEPYGGRGVQYVWPKPHQLEKALALHTSLGFQAKPHTCAEGAHNTINQLQLVAK